MLYYTSFSNAKPYDIRIWDCTSFKKHFHSQTEVYLCLQGEMKILIENTFYTLKENDVVFVFANESHEIFCDNYSTKVIIIGFNHELLGGAYNTIKTLSLDNRFFNLNNENISFKIINPLNEIKSVLLNKEENDISNLKFLSSLYSISAYICENKSNKPISQERLLRTKLTQKMHGILEYISENYHKDITLEQAAKIAGYDRSYFSKQFLKTVGITFHKYLNYYRISKALELLYDDSLSLAQVAELCGFSFQKNLSRLFKDTLGITPTEFKKLPPEEKAKLGVFNYV